MNLINRGVLGLALALALTPIAGCRTMLRW